MIIKNRKSLRYPIAITSIVLFSLTSLTGCKEKPHGVDYIKFDINESETKDIENEAFLNDIETKIDSSILKYNGASLRKDQNNNEYYEISFSIEDAKGNVMDEIADLYDILDTHLQTAEFKDKKVGVAITIQHFEPGVTIYAAELKNFDDKSIYDHISYIRVAGIDDMAEEYDPTFRYDFNNSACWESSTDADTYVFNPYVDYQSSIDLNKSNIKELEEFLMDDYEDIIDFGDMNAVTDGVHTPSVEWDINISSEGLSTSKYNSSAELMDSVRQSINGYISNHPDDEFLNLRITISFHEGDRSTGFIKSWNTSTKDYLGGFKSICYKDATVDELKKCTDITIIDLYGRPVEEVEEVLDNVDGIESVFVAYSNIKNELSPEYPNIEFR